MLKDFHYFNKLPKILLRFATFPFLVLTLRLLRKKWFGPTCIKGMGVAKKIIKIIHMDLLKKRFFKTSILDIIFKRDFRWALAWCVQAVVDFYICSHLFVPWLNQKQLRTEIEHTYSLNQILNSFFQIVIPRSGYLEKLPYHMDFGISHVYCK